LMPPRIKIRARDLERSQPNKRQLSISELSSPKNSFLSTNQSPVQDPFQNIRLDGSSIPTLRPICPSKRSTPRASTAGLQLPNLPLPVDEKCPFLIAPDSQRSQCRSTRSMNHCNSEAILSNVKPNLIFHASKRILPSGVKQPIKPKIPVPIEITNPSKESGISRSKIKSIVAFNFKREIRTPCFSFDTISSQKKNLQFSESESCGSESTALPQSGEISGYEISPSKVKVSQGQNNKEAYDRIKRLILDTDCLNMPDDPREMSFGDVYQMPETTKRPIKLVSPRMHFRN